MEKAQAHAGKMETQLRQWGAKLDELAAKISEADTEAKIDCHRRIAELKAKCQVAQSKLDEFTAAGGDKWDIFKTGVENAYDELEVAFKKLTN